MVLAKSRPEEPVATQGTLSEAVKALAISQSEGHIDEQDAKRILRMMVAAWFAEGLSHIPSHVLRLPAPRPRHYLAAFVTRRHTW